MRDLLVATGTEVEVNKVHVGSAQHARELRFVSSPTIRVNGRDVALELRESPCGCEACADGCDESIDCRVWVHEGRDHTEPPVAMIVDAILRKVYGGAVAEPECGPESFELPENLDRFFAGKAARATAQATAVTPLQADCCSPSERRTCCDAADKAACCDATTGGSCGCR